MSNFHIASIRNEQDRVEAAEQIKADRSMCSQLALTFS